MERNSSTSIASPSCQKPAKNQEAIKTCLWRRRDKDFASRFGNLLEFDIDSLIQEIKKLSSESPTLMKLLKGKLGGTPHKIVELRGGDFSGYLNTLGAEPILTKLSQLCERRGIRQDTLYLWQILEQMYKTSFVRLHELRFFPSTLTYSDPGQDSKAATILGSDLAMKLFSLMSSGTRRNRQKYSRVQVAFKSLTGSEFDVAVRIKEVDVVSEGKLRYGTSKRRIRVSRRPRIHAAWLWKRSQEAISK